MKSPLQRSLNAQQQRPNPYGYTPEEMAIKEQLDQRQRGGQALALSTIGNVAGLGRSMLAQEQADRGDLRTLSQARQAREEAERIRAAERENELADADTAFERQKEVIAINQQNRLAATAEREEARLQQLVTRYALMGDRDKAQFLRRLERDDKQTAAKLREILARGDQAVRLENVRQEGRMDMADIEQRYGLETLAAENAAKEALENLRFTNRLAQQNDQQAFIRDRDTWLNGMKRENLSFTNDLEKDVIRFKTDQGIRMAEIESDIGDEDYRVKAIIDRETDRINHGYVKELRELDFADEKALLDMRQKYTSEEKALDRALTRVVANTRAAAGARKLSGKMQDKYVNAGQGLATIADIENLTEGLSDDQLAQLNQPFVSAMIENFVPSDFKRIAQDKAIANGDPAILAFMAAGQEFENTLSRAFSGLAVTGYEMNARKSWSPFAPGITNAERRERMANIKRRLQNELAVMNSVSGRPDVGLNVLRAVEAIDGEGRRPFDDSTFNTPVEGSDVSSYLRQIGSFSGASTEELLAELDELEGG